jgi:hypothetical protein
MFEMTSDSVASHLLPTGLETIGPSHMKHVVEDIMKRMNTLTAGVAAVVLLTGFASSAFAGTIIMREPGSSYRQSNGGEFNAQGADAAILALYDVKAKVAVGGTVGFETFCLEHSETFNWNTPYAATVADRAIGGGPDLGDATAGSDYISVGTAYLYNLFAKGSLVPYNYNIGSGLRDDSAWMLQTAIWYLEDEGYFGPGAAGSNTFVALVTTEFGGLAAAKANNAGNLRASNVGALNLQQGNTLIQSQLILTVPDGGMTAMLLGLALGGLGLLRRKRG